MTVEAFATLCHKFFSVEKISSPSFLIFSKMLNVSNS